jgi:hypothetical protein
VIQSLKSLRKRTGIDNAGKTGRVDPSCEEDEEEEKERIKV